MSNDEQVRREHEATVTAVFCELARVREQVEARRNIDGRRVDWGHVGTLGGVHELLRAAARMLEGEV